MNRVNYVPGRELQSADLNAMQAEIEAHLRSQAQLALAGRVSGMEVSGTATGLQVAPGFGWDAQGRRLRASAAIDVDVSALQRPASGQYRWALVHGSYTTANRGTVTDVSRVDHAAYIDDKVSVAIAAGPEFAAADIGTARGTAVGRPAAPEGAVSLGLLIVDHSSTWDTLGDAAVRPSSQPAPEPSQPAQPAQPASIWSPGDIRPWPGAVIPSTWAVCDGAAVSRASNPDLFSAIGIAWGAGDGITTFNLPNLIGRALIGDGGTYRLGAIGGQAKVTLSVSQIPSHSHPVPKQPTHGPYTFNLGSFQPNFYAGNTGNVRSGTEGGGGAHENMPPYAVVKWIIRLG